MKLVFFAVCIFQLSSCASMKYKLDPFDKDVVCSKDSLKYYYKHKKDDNSLPIISSVMREIAKPVKSCYQRELDRSVEPYSANICLVVGFNKSGKRNFFEFSSSEKDVPKRLFECLSNIKRHKALKTTKIKNQSVLQPFRLYPENWAKYVNE